MEQRKMYNIADCSVTMNCTTPFMLRQCGRYEVQGEATPDLDLCLTQEQRQEGAGQGWPPELVEYNYTFAQFLQQILEQGGLCFHASAVAVEGEAVLFSADSGTGKSTQARLWQQYLSQQHQVVRINDDKPVLRVGQDEVWAYGSPWSGKHVIHTNAKAPVKALVFLQQAAGNRIRALTPQEAFELVFPQVFCVKTDARQRICVLQLLDGILRRVPVYHLSCNISQEAVRPAYQTIWKEKHHEN